MRTAAALVALAAPLALLGLAVAETGKPGFPDGWAGSWRGDLVITPAGGKEQTVPMELSIEATANPVRWRWAIRYGEQPVREYVLVVVDREAGRYLIDERNSVETPARFLAGELISVFAVSGSLLTARHRRDGEALWFEILVTSASPTGKTGGKGPVPEVGVHEIRAVQRARLIRAE